jgi:3-hydroxybutyryl-CoA dehydrogenase
MLMKIEDIRRVLVVGAGTMGRQIAFQCAGHGCDVALYDTSPQALEGAKPWLQTYCNGLNAAGILTFDQCKLALAKIACVADPKAAAQDADLISESIPEDPRLKGRVFAQFNSLCPPRTIFTTNTSTLVPSQFARASGRPDRLLALHFHQPAWTSNITDVMPHKGTAPEVTALVLEFARRIGQVPIHIRKEVHSYVFNALFGAVHREALRLAVQGVASVEDIDRAWMGITRASIGPFGSMDYVGLDTVWRIVNYWAGRLFFVRQLRRNANFLRQHVERGNLGVKSGQGFYKYPNPAYQQPGFVQRPRAPQ